MDVTEEEGEEKPEVMFRRSRRLDFNFKEERSCGRHMIFHHVLNGARAARSAIYFVIRPHLRCSQTNE